ncbi:protein kinase-like protein activator [Dothidotthia symphoricarpi CBS 119687]|uniref:Protein kinase-like protein activator n=1 Tax=Dothidotthia symphoricarpi CBS 119687 TaxID=1392245 RepID=A0A6A6AJQ8_9PLEO|nr:protein kinase-like protein activator [Dothidotthia symphoricarpi CBS 119687]KAF2131348.1 protein kinase-like protein activator [Dothidotthia symphoricarpi CBS 119687]
MASFFSSVRQGLAGRSNKSNNQQQQQQQQQQGGKTGTPSPTAQYSASPTFQQPSSVPPMPHSPAQSSAMSYEGPSEGSAQSGSRRPPFFFREEYSNLIVKGNFMTLAAKPKLVEEGEWLAHQVVEQYRLLEQMIDVIKVIDDRTGKPICNPDVCPTMSASGHTYTWLDNQKKPIKIPAIQYINLVQKWIVGKINDSTLFPTDTTSVTMAAPTYASGSLGTANAAPQPLGPTSLDAPLSQLAGREWMGKSSGFPESFESDLKSIYRQMMRCYAHIYHGHWLDPFWNVSAYKELNTCFIHFVNVGLLFKLIGDKEIEPMQPLVDLWAEKGLLPPAVKEVVPPRSSGGPPATAS